MAAPAIGNALILRLELPATATAGSFGRLAPAAGDAVARFVAPAAVESASSRCTPALVQGEELTATV